MKSLSETESGQGMQPKERDADTPYTISGIPPPMIVLLWEFAEPFVKRALDYANGEITTGDLKCGCLNRDMQLLLVHHGNWVVGAAITEIICYPQKKHCRVIVIAGEDIPAWAGILDTVLTAWAKTIGCDAVEIYVPAGLGETLHSCGYRDSHSVAIKSL